MVLTLFGKLPRSGLASSNGISIFNFLKVLWTDFHSSFTSLNSHQPGKGVPFSHQSIMRLSGDSPSFWGKMVYQCNFNLHVSDGRQWTFFHVFVTGTSSENCIFNSVVYFYWFFYWRYLIFEAFIYSWCYPFIHRIYGKIFPILYIVSSLCSLFPSLCRIL